jgi:hypothetical protein
MLGPWNCLRGHCSIFVPVPQITLVLPTVTFVHQSKHGGKLNWTKALVIGFFYIRTFGPTAMPNSNELDSG